MPNPVSNSTEERRDKGYRADAGQFFVAAELCRRGWVAVVTLGNCPNTDILVSNAAGTRFVHVQVKTFVPGSKTCSVGLKAERDFGENFFWVLAGVPTPESADPFEYFIVPAGEMSRTVGTGFKLWASTLGKKGQVRNQDNSIRTLALPPRAELGGWSLEPYRGKWSLIREALTT